VVQPFEEPEAYLAKDIRDRLTPDMIVRYCDALEIRPFDQSYYGSHSLLVTNANINPWVEVATETLSEAQARLDIQIQW